MKRLRGDNWITVEFKLEDFWIGAFWKRQRCNYYTANGHCIREVQIWICLIPCVPIHIIHASEYKVRP